MFECEFGSGQETYRDTRLCLRGKAPRGCAIETGCNKRLSNLGWTRCNGMQAIITHGISPLVFTPGKLYREMAGDTLTDVKISTGPTCVTEPMRTCSR